MNIGDFIEVRESEDAPAALESLFKRKYSRALPQFPHHVAAYYRSAGAEVPVCYVHFTDCGDILLGGGACVDNRVLRNMGVDERDAVHATGGLYHHVLAWSVRHFAPRFAAIFGYCGDALAERVDRAVGFQPTAHERLLVYWTRDADARRRGHMIEKANAFVPF
ncbi:MAG: hypothetical protein DYH18_07775 [Xanthomonadales bacterium PRO7]|nr:hypothetical protein [Xanthomonadales bacterium PRO7]HMM57624.1 hypothetical protein [Rudaea sp.]